MFIVHATSPTAEKMAQAAGLLPSMTGNKTYQVKTACSAAKAKTKLPTSAARKEVKKNG